MSLALPRIRSQGPDRLTIEVRPTPREIRSRARWVAGTALVTFTLVAGGLYLALGDRESGGGLPAILGGILFAGALVFASLARFAARRTLTFERPGPVLEVSGGSFVSRRRRFAIDARKLRGVSVVSAKESFRRDLVLELEGGGRVACLTLDGRSPREEEVAAADRALSEIRQAVEEFLHPSPEGEKR